MKASWLMALVFALGAVVQYNDPDPLPWIAVYGCAATASFLAAVGRPSLVLAACTGIVALAWAATYIPTVGTMSFGDLFETMKAERPAVELARELLGLVIIAGWMAVVVIFGARGSARSV